MCFFLLQPFKPKLRRVHCHTLDETFDGLERVEHHHQITGRIIHPLVVAKRQSLSRYYLLSLHDVAILRPNFFQRDFLFRIRKRAALIGLFVVVFHPISQILVVAFRQLPGLGLCLFLDGWLLLLVLFILFSLVFWVVKVFELLILLGWDDLPAVLVDVCYQLEPVVSHHPIEALVNFDLLNLLGYSSKSRIV